MRLVKLASSTALILFLSGCSISNFNKEAVKPKVDTSIEVVDSSSIRTIVDRNAIGFEWKKVTDPRVTGYNFYKGVPKTDGKKLKHIKLIDNRHTTHFVDTDVIPNTKYVYKISSQTQDGVESKTTSEHYVSTLSKLPAISFINAVSNLPRQIKIVWRPHASKDVKRYIIEKSSSVTNKWERIDSINGRLQAEYIDTDLGDDKTYSYRLIAETFDSLKSIPSEVVTASTKPLPLGVKETKASTDEPKKIKLTWESSITSDVKNYIVYRSSYKTLGFSELIRVNNKTFEIIDNLKEDGQEYYYKVTALDIDNLESLKDVNAVLGSSLVKPATPTIKLAQIQDGKAILNWENRDNRAIKYTIYKKAKISFFESKTTKYTNVEGLRFEDKKEIEKGKEYNFTIQAIDQFGLVSKESEPATLFIPKDKK